VLKVPALDPGVVAAIDDLGLAARLVVEGMRAGEHRSPFHGFNLEFSQYREYRPGDDLKYFDWKALARTDRLYTRQFRETTNMEVVFVLDASASMDFPAGDVSKFDYATIVTAAMAYLVITGGDAAGLLAMNDDGLTYVPARGGRGHLQLLLGRLARIEPHGRWQPRRAISRAAELLRRRGMLVVLSDFYDEEDATLVELKRAGARGHEVAMLQLISRQELDLPYNGALEFADLEDGARCLTDVAATRQAYKESISAFCDGWRQRARTGGIEYERFLTDQSPSWALRQYLVRREAAAGLSHTHPHRKP